MIHSFGVLDSASGGGSVKRLIHAYLARTSLLAVHYGAAVGVLSSVAADLYRRHSAGSRLAE
jgi:hypothetical protein